MKKNIYQQFLINNGFKIETDFNNTKEKFISIIGDQKFYYDLFQYHNHFYVIPISKKLIGKSNLLTTIFDGEEMIFPTFQTNIVSALSLTIPDIYFDVDFFVESVIGIIEFIDENETFLDNLFITPTNSYAMRQVQLSFCKGIASIEISDQVFADTHLMIFKFFRYYEFFYKGVDVGIEIVRKIFGFRANRTFTEDFVKSFYGFVDGVYTGKTDPYIGEKNKIGKTSELSKLELSKQRIFSEKTFSENYEIEFLDNCSHVNYEYLRFNFPEINSFTISRHILIKTENSDENLSMVYTYIEIDGEFFTDIFSANKSLLDLDEEKEINCVKISGFKEVDTPLSFFLLHTGPKKLVFLNSLEKLSLPVELAEITEEIFIEGPLKEIPDNRMEDYYKLKSLRLPDSITKIGNDCLSGCISLENFTFPENLIIVGKNVLYNCPKLTKIILPKFLIVFSENFLGLEPPLSRYREGIDEITLPEGYVEERNHQKFEIAFGGRRFKKNDIS